MSAELIFVNKLIVIYMIISYKVFMDFATKCTECPALEQVFTSLNIHVDRVTHILTHIYVMYNLSPAPNSFLISRGCN